MTRPERTVLVEILCDLKERRKTARAPEVIDYEITHVTKKLKKLYREATKTLGRVDSPIIPPQITYNEKLDGG